MNPRAGFPAYSLSRGAPSASWVLPHTNMKEKVAERVGFEPTVPSLGSPVFKTGSLNRSDISPNRLDYIIRYPAFCQG